MATNLLIGYPRIPNAASSYSITNGVAAERSPFSNLFGGNKTDLFTLDGDYNQPTFRFDLPSPETADFLYIGRFSILRELVALLNLRGGNSTDYNAATPVFVQPDFYAQPPTGPGLDDYIATFTESSAYSHWFVKYQTTSAIPHGKLFFGKAFDIGKDPNAPATITRFKIGGAKRRATFSFEFSWEGIAYAKAVEMYQIFYRSRRYQPVILFTRDWHDILMGNKVVFCRITSVTLPPRVTDFCDVTATFEEMP